MPGWMNYKLESRLPGEVSTTSDMQMIPFMEESEQELNRPLTRVKEESEKLALNSAFKKMKIMPSSPTTSWQIEGEKVEVVIDFLFLGSKITAHHDCSHEIKSRLLLGRKVWQT